MTHFRLKYIRVDIIDHFCDRSFKTFQVGSTEKLKLKIGGAREFFVKAKGLISFNDLYDFAI